MSDDIQTVQTDYADAMEMLFRQSQTIKRLQQENEAVWKECEEQNNSRCEMLRKISNLRAENEKLRAELEAIKSPPDYGTQKTMNEQLHYASVIAQKDREIERLRAAEAALKETGDEKL